MFTMRSWAYLTLVVALAGAALLAPHVWATPVQQDGPPGGTIPTVTPPSPGRPTPIVEPPAPEPDESPVPSPGPTPLPGPGEVPGATSPTPLAGAGTVTPEAANPLQLTVTLHPAIAWPGATVNFTATLANRGSAPVRQLVLANILSAGLVPVPRRAGALGTWDGQTLHTDVPVLAPGEQVVVTFSARVARDVKAGAVLQTMAVVTAANGVRGSVQTLVPMPPAQLPRTGACEGFQIRVRH